MLKGLVVSSAVVAMSVAVQLALLNAPRRRSALKLMAAAFVPTATAYLLIYWLTPPALGFLPPGMTTTPPALGLWNGLLILVLLFVTWMQFYYHIDRSITLRLITEFTRMPARSLTLPQLEARCGLAHLIDTRMQGLLSHGLIVRRGERFHKAPAGVLAASVARVARMILRLRPL